MRDSQAHRVIPTFYNFANFTFVYHRKVYAIAVSSMYLISYPLFGFAIAAIQFTATTAVYTYPQGSIPCKLYRNHNYADCAYRNLVSVPPLPYHKTLQDLNLSFNKLSYLPNDAFRGMGALRVLDLSNNLLQNITGSPFKDLLLLQDLNLENNLILSLDEGAFAGLKSLQSLNVYNHVRWKFTKLKNVVGTPFVELQSLRVLQLSVDLNVKMLMDCSLD